MLLCLPASFHSRAFSPKAVSCHNIHLDYALTQLELCYAQVYENGAENHDPEGAPYI